MELLNPIDIAWTVLKQDDFRQQDEKGFREAFADPKPQITQTATKPGGKSNPYARGMAGGRQPSTEMTRNVRTVHPAVAHRAGDITAVSNPGYRSDIPYPHELERGQPTIPVGKIPYSFYQQSPEEALEAALAMDAQGQYMGTE